MRKRRHVRRHKVRDQRPARQPAPVKTRVTDNDGFPAPDDYPLWRRDSVTEDAVAITVAREVGEPLPEPRHPLSWIFTEKAAPHETLIPHEKSLIWRACQAGYADAEENWQRACRQLAKRKSSGRWPELSKTVDDPA